MEEEKKIENEKTASPQLVAETGDEPCLVGQVLAQKYKIISEIGRGGMGTVYKAEHLQLHRLQAVKVMHRVLTEESQNLQRFGNEARAASLLGHENLLSVSDYGLTETKQPYIAMDFVAGQNLADYINEKGKLSFSECLQIFEQVAKGLVHAHEKGVIHRDLKPSNIIISSDTEHTARI